jgi:hypothetical protein
VTDYRTLKNKNREEKVKKEEFKEFEKGCMTHRSPFPSFLPFLSSFFDLFDFAVNS